MHCLASVTRHRKQGGKAQETAWWKSLVNWYHTSNTHADEEIQWIPNYNFLFSCHKHLWAYFSCRLQAGAGPPGMMATNCAAAVVEDSQVRQMPEQHDACSGDTAHSLLPANAGVVLPSVLTQRWMYFSRKVLGFNAGCVAGCCD